MAQDFLGSIAQEDVQFSTSILRTAKVGDNYYKLMVFVERYRFIVDPTHWVPVAGSNVQILVLDKNTYVAETKGLLRIWLQDYFASGHNYQCILADVHDEQNNPNLLDAMTDLRAAYVQMAPYAYFKTALIGDDNLLLPDVAVVLAELCTPDYTLLSGAPLYPYSTATPTDLNSDPIYKELKQRGLRAVMAAHQDITRNASLLQLSIAFQNLNVSGTPIGNSLDYKATDLITCSGPAGSNLTRTVRIYLGDNFISYIKPVGNSTGQNAFVGAYDILGGVIQAQWIVNYINYMSKVAVATFLTNPTRDVLRNADSYDTILTLMNNYLQMFGENGSGRLSNLLITAPGFSDLPAAAGDEIVVPNAWSAQYVDQLRKVTVSGTLVIAA